MKVIKQTYTLIAVLLMVVACRGQDATATRQSAETLLDRYGYSPSYSREKMQELHEAVVKLEITDADFFGEWRDGHWVKAPMLDYRYQEPALRAVEAAAKAGDYEHAAAALLAYYRTRESPEVKEIREMPENLSAKGSGFAARVLGTISNVVRSGWFLREDSSPRECVDLLKTVVKLGLQFSTGHSVNQSINAYGGNFIPHNHAMMMGVAAAWPELADSKRWVESSFTYMMAHLNYIIHDEDGSYVEHTFGYPRLVLPWLFGIRDAYLKEGLPVPDRFGEQIQRFARYLMFCALPSGSGVNWGEGYMGNSRTQLRKAANYFNDPELLWWTTSGKEGRPPVATDVQYPQAKV
jgi:hypothetical protein